MSSHTAPKVGDIIKADIADVICNVKVVEILPSDIEERWEGPLYIVEMLDENNFLGAIVGDRFDCSTEHLIK